MVEAESGDGRPGLEVRTYFVRSRNALVARADFAPLYVDYYLGLADSGQRHAEAADTLLKESIVALTLHCACRPWKETVAWTIHFEKPGLNVFVTGANETGDVTGTVFSEDVRAVGGNRLYADVAPGREPLRRSVVGFGKDRPFAAVERLYAQSEQRLGRFFQYAEEDYVLVSAQPDGDEAWLAELDETAVRRLDQDEPLSLLERRRYRWHCGCSQGRMLEVLAPAMRKDPAALFGNEASLRMRCPRCGARHVVTRESLEAFIA